MKLANAFGLGAALVALAATLALSPVAARAAEPRTLSGGVGVEGRAPHPDYSLKLVFAVKKGAYLADVGVKITSAKGATVLETTADGSWLFVDLAPGTYTVEATRKKTGDVVKAKVAVAKGKQTVHVMLF
ncbi:MAG TPA: hypothetical protein VL359_03640 [bacterium]|nr:hypothetical protein [bacterium]